MVRSRSRYRRRNRAGLWFFGAAVVLLLAIVLFIRYMISIDSVENAKEQQAIEQANQVVQLEQVLDVERSVWDKVTYVVRGTDASGEEQLVWVQDDDVKAFKASEGKTKAQIQDQLKALYPEASIMRISLNKVNLDQKAEYVWETQVRRKDEEGKKRVYYQFFRFSDGSPVGDAYAMPNQ